MEPGSRASQEERIRGGVGVRHTVGAEETTVEGRREGERVGERGEG